MTKNVGSVDRIVRLVLAVGLFSMFILLDGNLKFIGLAGVIPLVTGLISFCPLYKLTGICTSK